MTDADTTNAAVIAMRSAERQDEDEFGGHLFVVVPANAGTQ